MTKSCKRAALLLGALGLVKFTAGNAAAGETFVAIFDGRDLSAWNAVTHWVIEDGVLVLKDRSDRKGHTDTYL